MPEFFIRWEIEIEADNYRDAAEKALEVMRDSDSIATTFDVYGSGDVLPTFIDLQDGEDGDD